MTDMRTKEAAFGTAESDTHTILDSRSSSQRYMEGASTPYFLKNLLSYYRASTQAKLSLA